jgi:hypothetical protein
VTAFLAQTPTHTLALRFTMTAPTMLDWLSIAPSSTITIPNAPMLGATGFAAVAFVQSLQMEPIALAGECLALAWKSRMAPPFDSDRAKGYNQGLLTARLQELRSPMAAVELVSWTEDTVRWKRRGAATEQVLRMASGPRPFDRQIVAIESFP